MIVYLDLNIFDRLEKLLLLNSEEQDKYSFLNQKIINGEIKVPYSNAHLNDLFRGFQKNPNFIDGHLNNIGLLTKNLCICQYWGKNEVTWHNRSIRAFFEEKKSDLEFEPNSFSELFKDEPMMQTIMNAYKFIPLPDNFKQGYKDPMFGIMYPQSKIHNNQFALMDDIYNFQSRLKSDYSLYKSFKKYLIQSVQKIKSNPELLKSMNFKDVQKHLEVMDLAEISSIYLSKNNTSDNLLYSKVLDLFFKYDINGYKSDGNFNNMFDDALHTFYAAHCDYFITNDDRCIFKAKKTYEKLKIKTTVINSDEINEIFK